MSEVKSPGQAAYEKWRELNQHPIVTWDKLPKYTQLAWEAAVRAGIEYQKLGKG